MNVEEKDLEEAAKQTAADFEESSLAEAKQFKKGSRATSMYHYCSKRAILAFERLKFSMSKY